jgi:pimeloyl-ACP methyl ester carboxylesterase
MQLTPRDEGAIRLADGRALAYAEWGDPAGRPVLLMHPTPGCRLYCPDNYRVERTSAECGARVITVDRPGFGRSDLHALRHGLSVLGS